MSTVRWIVVLVVLAYAASLAAVLASQNRELREENAELRRQARVVAPDMYVPPVNTVTLDGSSVTIGEPDRGTRQVLLVFDAQCPFCRASLPAWDRLATALAEEGPTVEILGVSLDPTEETSEYVDEHDLTFPVTSVLDDGVRGTYRLGIVPLILTVEPGGLISYVRVGELTPGLGFDSVFASATAPLASP